jgi:hypothetical protein
LVLLVHQGLVPSSWLRAGNSVVRPVFAKEAKMIFSVPQFYRMPCCITNFCWVFVLAAAVFFDTTAMSASLEPNVLDMRLANAPRPDGVVVWDSLMKSVDAVTGQPTADFIFIFTNILPDNVTMLTVRPSCGCTTAKLPPLPWIIPAAGNGQIPISVNLAGKSGTLVKTINVGTDKASKTFTVKITVPSSMTLPMSDTNRANNIKIATADRPAVFQGDCASCHVRPAEGKTGKELYEAVCGTFVLRKSLPFVFTLS